MKFDRTKMTEALGQVVQRLHYPLEVMWVRARAVVRGLPVELSTHRGDVMAERGVFVDHSTLHRIAGR